MVVKVINNGATNGHAEIDIVEEAIEVDAELVDNVSMFLFTFL